MLHLEAPSMRREVCSVPVGTRHALTPAIIARISAAWSVVLQIHDTNSNENKMSGIPRQGAVAA